MKVFGKAMNYNERNLAAVEPVVQKFITVVCEVRGNLFYAHFNSYCRKVQFHRNSAWLVFGRSNNSFFSS